MNLNVIGNTLLVWYDLILNAVWS